MKHLYVHIAKIFSKCNIVYFVGSWRLNYTVGLSDRQLAMVENQTWTLMVQKFDVLLFSPQSPVQRFQKECIVYKGSTKHSKKIRNNNVGGRSPLESGVVQLVRRRAGSVYVTREQWYIQVRSARFHYTHHVSSWYITE